MRGHGHEGEGKGDSRMDGVHCSFYYLHTTTALICQPVASQAVLA